MNERVGASGREAVTHPASQPASLPADFFPTPFLNATHIPEPISSFPIRNPLLKYRFPYVFLHRQVQTLEKSFAEIQIPDICIGIRLAIGRDMQKKNLKLY